MKRWMLGFSAAALVAAAAIRTGASEAAKASPAAKLVERVLSAESRFEEDLRVLCDEIGGRITGSLGYEAALQWGGDAFRRAGASSVRLESYDAPARWEAESASAWIVSPARAPLRVISFGMAPSTPGALVAPVVDAGEGQAGDFVKLGARAKGAIALVRSKPMESFEDLIAEYLAGPEMLHSAVAAGARAVLFISTRPRHLLYRHTITWGRIAPLPLAQIAREDGLRILRLLEARREVRVQLDLRNRVGGPWSPQNVVAEVRGRAKPEEIVLLGAHLDAWDLGTGALDNGVNCALVVEVARAIAAGPRPRRTVRFVLFTSEETGLLGSRGYVAAHRAELDRHVAAVIHDIGDGKVTGYFTNGRPELNRAVQAALAAVASWGSNGASDEALLGTDNFDFLLEGIPNLVANQEAAKYLPDYHAESDTLDKIDIAQARKNAAVAALMIWALAENPDRPADRQSRAEVASLLEERGLAKQMQTYGLWEEWEKGQRGRK
jgi:hypothetical protein